MLLGICLTVEHHMIVMMMMMMPNLNVVINIALHAFFSFLKRGKVLKELFI